MSPHETPKDKGAKDILSGLPFFKGLSEHHLETIAGCASNVKFQAGETIFRENEDAAAFYVVRHGNVGIEIHVPARGPVTGETLHDQDVLGWSWLFPPYRWHYGARALTLVRATAFDGLCIRGKCDEDQVLGYELMKRFANIMVDRLQHTRLQLLDVYGHAKGIK
jgi:CRP-like cAMP-binding protein